MSAEAPSFAKTLVRGILGLLLGLFVGSVVNMALVSVSAHVIPPPAGVDVRNTDSLRASMHLFEPKHFLFPFLAHAFGTLAGSLVGFVVAVRYRAAIAFGIGTLFLAGGIAASLMLPAPGWFIALDLLLAYFPMAGLGSMIGRRIAGAR